MNNYGLEKFEERIENTATSLQLVLQCASDKKMWSKYEINDVYERYNIVFAILVFLAEKEYDSEYPNLEDINFFMSYVMSKIKNKNFNEDDLLPFSKFLIEDVLQNGGVTFNKVSCFNFETQKYQQKSICFIISSQVDGKVTYRLSPSSYEIVYNSLEIGNDNIDYEQYKLTVQISRNQYDDAINTADSIKHKILQEINKTVNITNLLMIDIDEEKERQFKKINEEVVHTYFEQFDKYDVLKDKLSIEKTKIENSLDNLVDNESDNEHLRTQIKNIVKLTDQLNEILKYQGELETVRNKMVNAHSEALELAMHDSIISKFNYKEQIFSEIIKNPNHLKNIHSIMNPLFFSMYEDVEEKLYSLEKCCDYDVHELLDEEEVVVKNDEELRQEKLEKERQQREEKLNEYRKSLGVLIKYIVEFGNDLMTLESVISNISNEDYEDFAPNIEIIKDILIKFRRAEHINLKTLKEAKKYGVQGGTYEFMIYKEVLDFFDTNYPNSNIEQITVIPSTDEDMVQIGTIDKEGNNVTLDCNNLIIKLKKGE